MQGCAGASRGEAIEASLTAATQSPGAQQIPGPGFSRAEGPGPGLGAAGVPQAFSSNSSHQHKRDQVPAGSLLRKDWAKTWQNGLTEAYTHTYTHTISNAFWGLSVLPVGMVGKKWSREEEKNPKDKSNFQLTAENLGHANAEMQKETTSKRGTAQTRLLEKWVGGFLLGARGA